MMWFDRHDMWGAPVMIAMKVNGRVYWIQGEYRDGKVEHTEPAVEGFPVFGEQTFRYYPSEDVEFRTHVDLTIKTNKLGWMEGTPPEDWSNDREIGAGQDHIGRADPRRLNSGEQSQD